MARDYIPRSNDKFNLFQQNLVKAVVDNAAAWGIPAAEVTELSDAGEEYAQLYKAISNKLNCTTAQRTAHLTFRHAYEKQIRHFANRYLRDNKTIEPSQLSAMLIKVRGKKRGSRSAIFETVDLVLVAISGCRIKFNCRQFHHNGGAALHPEADGVEIRYAFENKPATFEEYTHMLVSKKARVLLQVNQNMSGKKIYAIARWVNLSNHLLSGGWSQMAHDMLH